MSFNQVGVGDRVSAAAPFGYALLSPPLPGRFGRVRCSVLLGRRGALRFRGLLAIFTWPGTWATSSKTVSLGLSAWTVVVLPFRDAFAVFRLRGLAVGAGELAFLDWGSPDLAFLRRLRTGNHKGGFKSALFRISLLSGEFVARMEDVLDLYQPEYHPERPVVCFDETSRQLTGEVRRPIEAAPGRVARYDTEYQRNGTRNLFMICEPKGGWRHVAVTERRTAVDFAHQMRWLVDEAYPDAEVVRLVLDNLNTHKLGSLYEAFAPSEARRIAQRLEFHYTPTHGSWLNPVLSLPKGWLRSS